MSFSLSVVITLFEDWCQNGSNEEKGWDQEKSACSETRDTVMIGKGFYWYRDKFLIEESFDIFVAATHPTSKKSDLKQRQRKSFKGRQHFWTSSKLLIDGDSPECEIGLWVFWRIFEVIDSLRSLYVIFKGMVFSSWWMHLIAISVKEERMDDHHTVYDFRSVGSTSLAVKIFFHFLQLASACLTIGRSLSSITAVTFNLMSAGWKDMQFDSLIIWMGDLRTVAMLGK